MDVILTFFGFLALSIVVSVALLILILIKIRSSDHTFHMVYFVKKLISSPIFWLLISTLGFICTYSSIFNISIQEMGTDEFFLENLVPISYWVGVCIIVSGVFLIICLHGKKHFEISFIIVAVLLIISIRMIFPTVFVAIPAYEPDSTLYIQVTNSWVRSGIDFGQEGNYQHDYPLAFLIAYFFIKLGVPFEAFFRLAPFAIYAIDLLFIYLLGVEVSSGNKRNGAMTAFLASISSLNYWMAVHYCPDLVGSLFYLVSLYLVVRFASKRKMSWITLIPILVSIFVLILSHHLATLYFIVTLLGLSFSTWMFQSNLAKGKAKLAFLLLGIYTYTLWFAYGTIMYPSFFNIYVYFSESPSIFLQQTSLIDVLTLVTFPIFILLLSAFKFREYFKIQKVSDITKLPNKWKEIIMSRKRSSIVLPVYLFGFVFIGALLVVGFLIPSIFPVRVLEVFLLGFYPIASQALIRASHINPSKKRIALVMVLLGSITLVSIHRYYRQIQRRVIL